VIAAPTGQRSDTMQSNRVLQLAMLLSFGALALLLADWRFTDAAAGQAVVREHEEKSQFSTIRIIRENSVRTLLFIRESGEAITESMLDVEKPHELQLEYTRLMFASYLFRPRPERVLLVGLGGGSMVHFLKHYDPAVKVDVVEIDPAIIKIADKFFGVRGGGNVNIVNQDAFEYLKKTESRYDVIWMDAFLKPSPQTDTTGVPLSLKTIQFYKDVQKKLTAGGLVVFNVHSHEKVQDDLKNISDAFPQMYVFRLSNFRGYIVVGSLEQQRSEIARLRGGAVDLDRRFKTSFTFRDMVERLAP
jgi:spermidine synthase